MGCYRRLCRRHQLYPCVTLHEALGGVRAEDYVDKLHLHQAASIRVAEHLAAIARRAYPGPARGETAAPPSASCPRAPRKRAAPAAELNLLRPSTATNSSKSRAAARAAGREVDASPH